MAMAARRRPQKVRLLVRLTLDPDIDEPLLAALQATPRGKRAALVRMWLRLAYPSLAKTVASYGREDEDAPWLDALAVDD